MSFKDKQKRKEYNQKYGINHSEQISIHKKQYYQNTKDDKRRYYQQNRELILAKKKEYRLKNKESLNKSINKRRKQKPEIYKKQYISSYNRRHRELGFVPLNQYFNGSNAHHLDIDNVIYIPTELHQAYPHQQNNNEQMKEINIKAWNYLEASVL